MCLGGFKAPIQISDRENISEVGLAFLASKEVPEPVSRAILSLADQWLRLPASTAWGGVSIPG